MYSSGNITRLRRKRAVILILKLLNKRMYLKRILSPKRGRMFSRRVTSTRLKIKMLRKARTLLLMILQRKTSEKVIRL